MINLYESIISHDFITYLPKKHTYTILTDWQKGSNTDHVRRYSFSELLKNPTKISIIWELICIGQYLSSKDMIIFDNLIKISCTWINCNPGLISIIKKSTPEENDIVMMINHWYTIKEPISHEDMILSMRKKSYIRIFDKPIASKISILDRNQGIAYLSWSQLQSHFTVLSTISSSDDVSWALTVCSKWSDNIFEFYIWSTISTILSDEIISSIKRTQHIIIIIDHKATEELWLFCDTLIKTYCDKNVIIQYIFPQFHLASSILEDYLYEEANFDQPAFESYIMESIENYNIHVS